MPIKPPTKLPYKKLELIEFLILTIPLDSYIIPPPLILIIRPSIVKLSISICFEFESTNRQPKSVNESNYK